MQLVGKSTRSPTLNGLESHRIESHGDNVLNHNYTYKNGQYSPEGLPGAYMIVHSSKEFFSSREKSCGVHNYTSVASQS